MSLIYPKNFKFILRGPNRFQNGTKGWFNKGMLMNLGFQHAISSTNATCVVFHDVDVVPVDDRNSYMCGAVPRHLATYINNGT